MATAIITKPTFTLADRLRIQQERSRNREFIACGKLSAVLLERQIDMPGYSQSRPRYANREQEKQLRERPWMQPFSEAQSVAWTRCTLDWLGRRESPTLAVSRDGYDLLLPYGLPPLPDIPDPRWVSKRATDVAPRIPQLLEERACGKLTGRDGRIYLIFQPVIQLSVMVAGQDRKGAFGSIYGRTDPADGTHLALLIDPDAMRGYFVGGRFQQGG